MTILEGFSQRMIGALAWLLLFGWLAASCPARVAIAQVLAANGVKIERDSLIPEASRKIAPDFILQDAQGNAITLSARKGKVVLLDFWATWCGGCKLEIPWYMQFQQQYSSQGLAIIGVSMDDDGWKSVRPFLLQKRDPETGGDTAMKYPVVIGSEALGKKFGLTSMPLTLLIDREGRIALSHMGVVDRADFEMHIRQLLKEEPGP